MFDENDQPATLQVTPKPLAGYRGTWGMLKQPGHSPRRRGLLGESGRGW